MDKFFRRLEHNNDIGILLLRLFVGVRLIYGVFDNVISWEHMIKFRDFLQQFQFPLPLIAAIISVYAQLIAGIMFIVGWKVRYAALLMIINFAIALIMVHWGQTFELMTPAMAILFISILILFHWAGRYSLGKHKQQRELHAVK